MNNKRFILAVFTSLLSVSVLSQINADIIRPSANADQFTLALKAEAALSRGQLSLNIPLLELKGKGYDLPVSLVFYNGDVTACTEASSVGLGWALMAGDMIKYDDGHPDCFYNNPEEKRVITGTEQTTAKALGEITDNEVTRTDHMGVHILMDGPTSNRPIEKETEFIYTKERINER